MNYSTIPVSGRSTQQRREIPSSYYVEESRKVPSMEHFLNGARTTLTVGLKKNKIVFLLPISISVKLGHCVVRSQGAPRRHAVARLVALKLRGAFHHRSHPGQRHCRVIDRFDWKWKGKWPDGAVPPSLGDSGKINVGKKSGQDSGVTVSNSTLPGIDGTSEWTG